MNNRKQYLPETLQKHKNQTFWQIIFPIIFGAVLMIATGGFVIAISSTPGTYATGLKWANISLIAIILISLFAGFIFLLLIILMIYGLTKLFEVAPIYTQLAQGYVYRAATILITAADRATQPFLAIISWKAGSQSLIHSITKRKS